MGSVEYGPYFKPSATSILTYRGMLQEIALFTVSSIAYAEYDLVFASFTFELSR